MCTQHKRSKRCSSEHTSDGSSSKPSRAAEGLYNNARNDLEGNRYEHNCSVGPHFRCIERPLIKIIKFFIKLIWFSSNVVVCLLRNVQMVSIMSCRSKNFLLSNSSIKMDLLKLSAMDADGLASYLSTYQDDVDSFLLENKSIENIALFLEIYR
jgi:hypothetical protein